jgi:cytochrome c biogenesis protein CcmG, thiol:disulfide interchange protein DsbE
MQKLLYFVALLLLPAAVFCQNEPDLQTSEPFPFTVTLFAPDSTAATSASVLDKKNNATLIAFWLTTCVPCAYELDAYAKQYATWQKDYDLRIVAISIDFPQRFRKIAERVNEKKYPFPVFWDQFRMFKMIMPGELNGLPQVFLFDKNGKMVWRHKGYSTGAEAEMVELLKGMKG